jgi:hypothetical protein
MYSAKGVAAILGGGLAAMLYQRFGSWSAPFYGSATLALIAAVSALVLRSTPMPRNRVSQPTPLRVPAT